MNKLLDSLNQYKIKPYADKGISQTTLKLIACISMLIDHFGYILVGNCLIANAASAAEYNKLYVFYRICRNLGRIAFPIFAFCIVEGFYHTKSRIKYLIRLLVFAICCEPLYDLCFHNEYFYWSNQNIFTTLATGLACIIIVDALFEKFKDRLNRYILIVSMFLTIAIFALLAQVLHFDYGAYGVIVIAIFYLFYETRIARDVVSLICIGSYNIYSSAAIIPLWFYNGKKGKGLKYFFYLFYPLHLVVLYLITKYIN